MHWSAWNETPTSNQRQEPELSDEVQAQISKLECLKDRHGLALLWRAIRDTVGGPETARLVALCAGLVALG